MPDIKLREVAENTIKTVDKAAMAGERMKDAYIRLKERGKSDKEYAADQMTGGIEDMAHDAVRAGEKLVRKRMEAARTSKLRTTASSVHIPCNDQGASATGTAQPGSGQSANPRQFVRQKPVNTSIKERPRTASVKTAGGRIKMANRSAGAKKTARKSVSAAQQAVKTAKAARANRTAVQTTREAVRTAVSAVKGIIAGTKALAAAIAAGGWVSVLVVVVVCLIGLFVGSSYGIFLSSEDTGSSQTMREVVKEINDEYLAKLDEIKALNPHDKLEMSGSRAVWPEVMAVYAVRTTTDPDDPQEVASVTEEKKALLKDIFWQMNTISFRTAVVSEMQYIETDDGSGNIVTEQVPVTRTYLYITVGHKTAADMASELIFSPDQTEQLDILLDEENDTLWTAVLYGIAATDGQIIAVARSQIGNVGGQPYWSWYGYANRVAWCACFVSWCANECGYIEAGIIPKFASCANGVQWFKSHGQWADASIEPAPGMLIFFDWNRDGHSDHVGIVEKCENGIVHTIEGNSSDSCRERSYAVGHYQIMGYGVVFSN